MNRKRARKKEKKKKKKKTFNHTYTERMERLLKMPFPYAGSPSSLAGVY